MHSKDKLRLKDPHAAPTNLDLQQALGSSYAAYEAFQAALTNLDIQQEWQWYTPYKVWAAKGVHRWTTPRGANKEKNLYWLYVFDGYFSVAVWFKEKNRFEVLDADVSEKTKQLISDAKTMGNLPTFPVEFEVTTDEPLADICTLLDCKKRIEK